MRRGNLSHPPDSFSPMSNFDTFQPVIEPDADPFADPVRYLAEHGIEAELVEVMTPLPEAA